MSIQAVSLDVVAICPDIHTAKNTKIMNYINPQAICPTVKIVTAMDTARWTRMAIRARMREVAIISTGKGHKSLMKF